MDEKQSDLFAKVPEVTFLLWIVKIFATTLGETSGEAVSRRDDQPCPSLQERPPIGVIAPSQRTLVNAITYKAPLKMRIPARTCLEFLASFQ
jgi:hypothetical protein